VAYPGHRMLLAVQRSDIWYSQMGNGNADFGVAVRPETSTLANEKAVKRHDDMEVTHERK
jgi:hypothetical protein